jgi:hypothetical protein
MLGGRTMKALILAVLATCISFVFATMGFRLWRLAHRAFALLFVFGVCCAFMVAAYFLTPDDLLLFPSALLAQPKWFDLASALFFFAAAFFGGILQIYNLADRGLSLRILIDLLEQPRQRGTPELLFDAYSAGRGIGWMYSKRIEDMRQNGLITLADGDVTLTDRGARIARVFGFLRELARVRAD